VADSKTIIDSASQAVRSLHPYVPGKPVEELEREYGITDAIKLASNENPLGPAREVRQAMQDAVANTNRYPDGAGFYLKQELAAHLAVEPDMITLGNGSNDVLVLLAEAFLTPDTNAVFSQYAFVVYPLAVQATGAAAKVVAANSADGEQPYGHDLDAMADAIDADTRIVFIANPNNPTGTWIEADDLEAFIANVPEHVVVVLDEAYCEYGDPETQLLSISWLQQFPNLVITRTFSKAYGLAGMRVGYGLSSPGVAELLNRIRQPFNINGIALAAAEAALETPEYVEVARMANLVGRQYVSDSLTSIPGVSVVPSRGNFLLVDLGRDALPVYEALLREGIIVRPVGNYGLPNHLRVSIGTRSENEAFVVAFNKVIGLA